MYEHVSSYFSLFNVLAFGVTFTFLAYLGRKAYRAYKSKQDKY